MFYRRPIILALPLLLALAAAARAEIARAKLDFNRDIRPILSENCFTCHGPDASKRKAELRLDVKDAAFGKGESGEVAVVPGSLEKSELIRRITTKDKDDVMPPPKEHKPLKPAQVELLKRWVKEGATWTGHWAFEPVKQPPVPAVAGATNPIDAFVHARLKLEGLTPSPEEEKARLIRRVSLDLTGLPPSIAEVDEFVKDSAPGAFEKVVDRLLKSPHFGERLAVPWLDLARYGDTSGYHNDSLRDMWLWREWVVNAFNANMPFSQFTIEQIAGDLLPKATIQQQVASGFHRNVMTSDEGGIIESEYLNLYVVDRVATTGVTWLGMTVACAQCHDHKYDPITQRDFYQVYAFFNNVPETGKDGVRDRNPKPFLKVPLPEQEKELQRLDGEIAGAQKAAEEFNRTLPEKQLAWEKETAQAAEPKGPVVRFTLDENGNGTSDTRQAVAATAHGESAFVDGTFAKGYETKGQGWLEYGDKFGFEKDQPFSVAAWVRPEATGGTAFAKRDGGEAAPGWEIEFKNLKLNFYLVQKWPGEIIHVEAEKAVAAKVLSHLAFTYDGSGKAAGVKLFVNGEPAKLIVRTDKLAGSIKSAAPFRIGRRSADASPFNGIVEDLRIYGRALAPEEAASLTASALAALPPEQRKPEHKDPLQKAFFQKLGTNPGVFAKRVDDLKKSKAGVEKAMPNTMVMAEMDKPRDTFMKVRGAYDQNGDKVTAAVPAFLPQIPARADTKPLNRLDFAQWLVSPQQPLTARVTVNRWWAMLFGTGIVKTANDFGSQGEWPSHPELLDWLAADFMRDWDTKRAIRQIVLSATYRQSAKAAPALLARDSENRLLARGPRQRLDAEMIRDNALAIGGILNPALGGKSIKPAQPAGTWEINEMSGYNYQKSTGADLYRRGLYVYWRRSTVYPSFVTLDAPTREFCVAQRAKTSTPLQSLVLMNDPVFVEAARAFAQRILQQGGSDDPSRLAFAWRLALARPPSEKERAILDRTLQRQLATYSQDKEAAKKLASVGDLPKAPGLDDTQLAAWTAVANVLLNLNETISN
jgi:mono/diheme cytochrome c family protein